MLETKYKFKAVDLAGRRISGILKGASKEDVAKNLKQQGYFIVTPILPLKKRQRLLVTTTQKKLDKVIISVFSKKLGDLLKGGVSLLAALNVLASEKTNKKLAGGLKSVIEDLERGKTFSNSIEKTNLFPYFFIQTITIGELSGSLPESLVILSKFYQSQNQILKKLKRAFIYPAFVLVGAILVIVTFILFVLPEANKFLITQGKELPLFTKILIGLVSKQALIAAVAVGGILFLAALVAWLSGRGRVVVSMIFWKTPMFSKAYQTFQYHNLSKGLGFMLTNGITLTEALRNYQNLSKDYLLQNKLYQIEAKVSQGFTLTESIREAKIFPPTEQTLIRVGEESGEVGEIFHYLADRFEEQLEDYLNKLTGYLEPILIILLTIVVAVVVGGILLPLYDFTNLRY